MRLGSAKALRQKHAWYDQKSQVTEAGMEKAVRRVVGNEVREVACWEFSLREHREGQGIHINNPAPTDSVQSAFGHTDSLHPHYKPREAE